MGSVRGLKPHDKHTLDRCHVLCAVHLAIGVGFNFAVQRGSRAGLACALGVLVGV